MKSELKFEKDGSLLTITASGNPSLEGFKTHLEACASSLDWRDGMPVLCDFRGLEASKLSVGLLRQIVDLHKEFIDRHGSNPLAIVVSRPADFGMVRMWEAYAHDLYPKHEVFYSIEEALKWLQER